MELRGGHGSQGAVAQEDGAIVVLDQLGGLADGEGPHADGDGDGGFAVGHGVGVLERRGGVQLAARSPEVEVASVVPRR